MAVGAHGAIRGDNVVAFGLGAIPTLALAFADGGFGAESWAWATFGLACVVLAAVLRVRRTVVGTRALVLVALVGATAAWIALSTLWSRSDSLTVPEAQRALLYLTGVAAAALLVRAASWRPLLLGVLSGSSIAIVWGLVSYLLNREGTPAQFEGFLLHSPMGYANAMAIAAVIAILIGLGFVADGRAELPRVACAVLLVPLASALTLTGSRAAWGALALGLAVLLAATPSRRPAIRAWALVLVLPAVSAGVLWSAGLDDPDLYGARAGRRGNAYLAVVAGLTALSVVPALAVTRGSRVVASVRAASKVAWLGAAAALAAIVLVLAVRTPDLGGDRPDYWRAALAEFAEHPILGTGAGTFHQVWLERRPTGASVRDAHSIAVEGLSELGIVGVVLVALVLGAPLVWGLGARQQTLAPSALAAYAAFGAHALVDWDWELPAVTLSALFIAVALSLAADGAVGTVALSRGARVGAGVAAVAVGIVAVAGFIGASALENAQDALARGDGERAAREARKAGRWQPWSVEPLLTEGRAEIELSHFEPAHEAFTRAVQRDPNDYRAWLALAAVSSGDARELAVLRVQALNPRAVAGLQSSSP